MKNKIILPATILIGIIILNVILISPVKRENTRLKEISANLENQSYDDESIKYLLEETNSLRDSKKETLNKESCEENYTEKNRVVKSSNSKDKFYQMVCTNPYIEFIENNSSEGKKSYLLGMKCSEKEIKNLLKLVDNKGIDISIEKITYRKVNNNGEYDILVNLF